MDNSQPALKLTPKDLLALKLDGNSTLRDVLMSHALGGRFGEEVGVGAAPEERETIFEGMARTIINTVLLDAAQAASGNPSFGGDACDFGEWIKDQIKD